MRAKSILAGAVLALALPVSGWAQASNSNIYPQGPYARIAIGYNGLHNHGFPITSTVINGPAGTVIVPGGGDTVAQAETKSAGGFAAAAAYGYDFGPVWFLGHVHAEAELVYRYNSLDKIRLRTASASFKEPNANGNTQTVSLLINFVNDFNPHTLFDPYVGGGFGFAWIGFNNYGIELTGSQQVFPNSMFSLLPKHRLVDDSDVVFAWQGIAGIRSYLTDAFTVDVNYRYFRTHNPSYNNAVGQTIKSSYTANTIMIGLTYNY
jgi:opacity protein-like surface antigen